jgi:hypothetical protein
MLLPFPQADNNPGRYAAVFLFFCVCLFDTAAAQPELTIRNGWLVHGQKVIWGYGQRSALWGETDASLPNITRRVPNEKPLPARTENLRLLTNSMIRYGYPGLEHYYGLWYDRRRDAHDTVARFTTGVVPPFLEQPWARSHKGKAWDGLSKYDLTEFNRWYFKRLKNFVRLSEKRGTVLLHNSYLQHALLEFQAHYVDFAWRPENNIQQLNLPWGIPAANAFYDASHQHLKQLHTLYLRKTLNTLASSSHVIHFIGQEYTGSRSFMRFWINTILAWEQETGRNVYIGLGATKDVMDSILED